MMRGCGPGDAVIGRGTGSLGWVAVGASPRSGSSPAGSRRSVAAVCFQRWLLTALMLMLVLVLVLCACVCVIGGCFCWLCTPRLSFDFLLVPLRWYREPHGRVRVQKRKRRAAVRAKAQPRRAAPTGFPTVRKSMEAFRASKLSQAMAELADGMSRDCFVSPASAAVFWLSVSERLLLSETKTLGRLEHWQLLDKKAPAVTLGGGWRTHDSEKRRCRTCLAALQSPHRGYSTSH